MNRHATPLPLREILHNLLREKRTEFILGMIVSTTFLFLALYGLRTPIGIFSARMSQGVAKLTRQMSPQRPDRPDSLASIIAQDDRLAYLTPPPTDTRSDESFSESGQISAIQSKEVTYTQNTYIVQPGDTLGIIAEKVYGDRNAWVMIARENNITNPDIVEVGTSLRIPR